MYRKTQHVHIEHQPREHPVDCRVCFRAETWNLSAICEACEADADIYALDLNEWVVTPSHHAELA